MPLAAVIARPGVLSEHFEAAVRSRLDGVKLGAFDECVVDWLAGWDAETVGAICSLLDRRRDSSHGGPRRGARRVAAGGRPMTRHVGAWCARHDEDLCTSVDRPMTSEAGGRYNLWASQRVGDAGSQIVLDGPGAHGSPLDVETWRWLLEVNDELGAGLWDSVEAIFDELDGSRR